MLELAQTLQASGAAVLVVWAVASDAGLDSDAALFLIGAVCQPLGVGAPCPPLGILRAWLIPFSALAN